MLLNIFSHYWQLTKNPRDTTLVSLRKFSQGGFQVSKLYDSLYEKNTLNFYSGFQNRLYLSKELIKWSKMNYCTSHQVVWCGSNSLYKIAEDCNAHAQSTVLQISILNFSGQMFRREFEMSHFSCINIAFCTNV